MNFFFLRNLILLYSTDRSKNHAPHAIPSWNTASSTTQINSERLLKQTKLFQERTTTIILNFFLPFIFIIMESSFTFYEKVVRIKSKIHNTKNSRDTRFCSMNLGSRKQLALAIKVELLEQEDSKHDKSRSSDQRTNNNSGNCTSRKPF